MDHRRLLICGRAQRETDQARRLVISELHAADSKSHLGWVFDGWRHYLAAGAGEPDCVQQAFGVLGKGSDLIETVRGVGYRFRALDK